MNCKETLTWISENDWEILPNDIAQHCNECATCKEKIQNLQEELSLLKIKDNFTVDLSSRILQKISLRARMRKRKRWIVSSMSIAASIALVFTIVTIQDIHSRKQDQMIAEMFQEIYFADTEYGAFGNDDFMSQFE